MNLLLWSSGNRLFRLKNSEHLWQQSSISMQCHDAFFYFACHLQIKCFFQQFKTVLFFCFMLYQLGEEEMVYTSVKAYFDTMIKRFLPSGFVDVNNLCLCELFEHHFTTAPLIKFHRLRWFCNLFSLFLGPEIFSVPL